jgi:hypothetical protein
MMNSDDEWDNVQQDRDNSITSVGSGALRLTLLFGSVAVAFALFLVPIMNRNDGFSFGNRASGQGLDQISTGSISKSNAYVIRKSVLQRSPNSICVIRADGGKSGDC